MTCRRFHIKRKVLVEKYRERLKDIDGIQLNVSQKEVKPNYSYFPIIVDEKKYGKTRNELFDYLAEHNIFAR